MLQWIDDRWHLAGRGIHAGDVLEMCGENNKWFRVRIETADSGRSLFAHLDMHGLTFVRHVDTEWDKLRWE